MLHCKLVRVGCFSTDGGRLVLIDNGKGAQMGRFKGNQKHMIKSVFLFKMDQTIVLSRPSIRKSGFGGMNLFSLDSALLLKV